MNDSANCGVDDAGAHPAAIFTSQKKSSGISASNFGESFELKGRFASKPRDVDPTIVKNVEHAPTRVIKDKLSDLEYCWLKLPAGKRAASSAMLRVTIEAAGNVTQARVDGELPAGVGKCITAAANRWTFPAADARSEIEHGITLTTK